MSSLLSTATYMAQATGNWHGECDSFHSFFECWIVEQDQHLQELLSASKENDQQHGPEFERRVLGPLLERVVNHYEGYYRAKSRWAKKDVLSMFNPSWRSSLEAVFLWVGGWCPSMAFHLLYSKAGIQFSARFNELVRGLSTGDLGDLSPGQLVRLDQLHKSTLMNEKKIGEKLAKKQETVANPTMVELTHVLTEIMQTGDGVTDQEGWLEAAMAPKEEGLVRILERADELRMKTLKGVIDILSPIQGVYFLIAAAELHLRVHECGKIRDARQQHTNLNGGIGNGRGYRHQ